MRIAVITTSYPSHEDCPSGHFVRTEVEALLAEGHRVTLFLPRTAPRSEAAVATPRRAQERVATPERSDVELGPRGTRSDANLEIRELAHFDLFGWPGAVERLRERPLRGLGLWPFIRGTRRELKRLGPFDKIVAHWLIPGFWPISRDFDVETVAVAHGSDVGLLERMPKWLQRRIVSALSRDNLQLRCVSSHLAARMTRLFELHHRRPPPLCVEPAAITLPALPSRDELRRELGWSNCPIVVIVGRVVAGKRVDVALSLLRNGVVSGRLPHDTAVIVIGDGPLRVPMMRRFQDVEWLGQLERRDSLRYIRAADLLVSASEHEGAPTVIREAIGLGTPVVAANAGDLSHWAREHCALTVVDAFTDDPTGAAGLAVAQCLEHRGGGVPRAIDKN